MKKILSDSENINKLSNKLSQLEEITKYNSDDHKEEWTIAYSLNDLEESFTEFLKDDLPKLVDPNLSNEQLRDVLQKIGEEFRHILYHISSMRFYSYLENAKLTVNHQDRK